MKNLADSTDHVRQSRRWFSALLWRAFPARSEHELALKAAPVLRVSTRQVKNWLREENDASLRHVTRVMVIAGFEFAFARIEGKS